MNGDHGLAAASCASACNVLRAALGKVRDGDYVDSYATARSAELIEHHSVVRQLEIERYLTQF